MGVHLIYENKRKKTSKQKFYSSFLLHEMAEFGIRWNMRNRKPYIFLAAYFLVIFLWLWYCYRQVQKACVEAGHTAQNENGILEVIPWQEEGFDDREETSYPIGEDSKEKEEEESKKSNTKEETAAEDKEAPTQESEKGEEDGDSSEEEHDNGHQEEADGEEDRESNGEKRETGETEKIRVVLTGTGGIYHEEILLEAGDESLEITAKSPYFEKTNVIRIRAGSSEGEALRVMSLNKSCGHPSYQGVLEIRREEAGLVLINEVSLEEYVKGVLPSEMPSSYPLEALKAQAVCARTYAKMKMENKVYPQYDAAVDDTTACQVYRNLETAAQGDLAVDETAGEVLRREDGSYMECYYYSTSCGRGAEVSVWHGGETQRPALIKSQEEIDLMNQEFFDYISQEYKGHLEAEDAFYRWDYSVKEADQKEIFERCRNRQGVNEKLIWAESRKDGSPCEITKEKLGNIMDMSIVERQEGGVGDCVKISCENGEVYVWGEYNIRHVLCQGGAVKLRDGTTFQVKELLPSAFISLQSVCNKKGNMVGYIVVGGGFGHGVGLSQNGAKHMALAGNDYREILETYYKK